VLLVIAACAAAPLPFRLVEVAKVAQITSIHPTPLAEGEVWVTTQEGKVLRIDGAAPPAALLDIRARIVSGGEMGLLGLALAPTFPKDPRVFVNYTHKPAGKLRTAVVSYRWDGARFDPASEILVLGFDQPYSNHNSGSLAFGPDGMLYVGVGDGGSGGDPHGHGQDLGTWLGSILRVDVAEAPYRVPGDNPFVDTPGAAPEIWAYGIRNPWGMAFDGDTLWFADVGQNTWEEIDRGVKGGNYGWNIMEGTHCFQTPVCDTSRFVPPVAEYSHTEGRSVTGGFVYRGPSIPALDGRYVYADFATGRMWAVPADGGAATVLGELRINPSAFGKDGKGRLHVADYGGTLYRVEP